MPFVLERSWIGQRVSVRRAVRHPDGAGVAFADVVGDLLALDADHAVVETRDELVEIPVTQVAIARLVPPSTRDELDLQAAIAQGWRPAESEQLGGWTLRASGGFSGRANSVLPLGAPGLAMDAALEYVTRWYAARGLPAKFQLAVEARRLLDADLGERGWIASEDVHVLTQRLPQSATRERHAVTVTAEPDDDWFGMYRAGAGAGTDARGVLLRHDCVGFAELRDGAELAAIGRGTVDGQWLGVSAVEVIPGARRRGYATAIMTALTAWGAEHGAVRAHLEVSSSNAPAGALYRALGYRPHHDYRYRTAPGS
jgi:ribosomal protein S18 acetylase RimI-like enzyme